MNRGTNVPESAEPGLFDLMRWYGERHDQALRSYVGADVAESHVYWILRGVVVAIWSGADLESAIADGDRQWRAYAQRQEEKVNSAAKIKTGPRAGQSPQQGRNSSSTSAGCAGSVRGLRTLPRPPSPASAGRLRPGTSDPAGVRGLR